MPKAKILRKHIFFLLLVQKFQNKNKGLIFARPINFQLKKNFKQLLAQVTLAQVTLAQVTLAQVT